MKKPQLKKIIATISILFGFVGGLILPIINNIYSLDLLRVAGVLVGIQWVLLFIFLKIKK